MPDLLLHLRAHIALCAGALLAGAVIAIPLGVRIAHDDRIRPYALAFTNTARVIPSLAVLTLVLPYLGIGVRPALLALALLAIPPMLINTDVAFRTLPAAAVDAATGIGMTPSQIVRRIEWPYALPTVFAGVRTATVEVIASATLAAFIGGGGLGEYIINGLALNDMRMLVAGAAAVALLALAADAVLGAVQRRLGSQLQ